MDEKHGRTQSWERRHLACARQTGRLRTQGQARCLRSQGHLDLGVCKIDNGTSENGNFNTRIELMKTSLSNKPMEMHRLVHSTVVVASLRKTHIHKEPAFCKE